METVDIFTIKTKTVEESNVLETIAKALKFEFEISRNNVNHSKKEILASIKKGLLEINKLEKSGKKGTLLKDFLNEL